MELNGSTKTPLAASLDRIDSSKPYQIDNVEFVCLCVNFAKNDFPKEDVVAFFKNLRLHSETDITRLS